MIFVSEKPSCMPERLVLFIIHRQEESKGKRLARIFHEWLTPTKDMAVLPGVLGCSFGRLRTSSP